MCGEKTLMVTWFLPCLKSTQGLKKPNILVRNCTQAAAIKGCAQCLIFGLPPHYTPYTHRGCAPGQPRRRKEPPGHPCPGCVHHWPWAGASTITPDGCCPSAAAPNQPSEDCVSSGQSNPIKAFWRRKKITAST